MSPETVHSWYPENNFLKNSTLVRAEFGTVAVGRKADLILLEGNPLEDVSNINKRAGVMVRRRWYSQVELMSELEKLAERIRSKSQ